ncbi:MAG: GyrI-like domain-containing protein [Bacteroidota bacterium]|nr:GyrI-like domain-containing protein [Bacteroidota bacterium]
MKIVKRISIVLGILVGIWLILALIAPSSAHVERSVMVNAPAATVFDQVNTMQNWKSWSYWDNIDKNMKDSFAGPPAGIGAVHYWESQNDSVGKGSLTITKSEPNAFVETTLNFEGMGTSVGGWKMKDTAGAVQVTTYMDMEAPFFMRPMMLFMNMDEMLGADFEKSLSGLKRVAESAATSTPSSNVKIEVTIVDPMKMMSIKDSCTLAEISQKLGALYGEIGAEATKQGLTQKGSVFAIYHKVVTNADGSMFFVLEAGIPVDKAGKSDGRVKYSDVPAGNVVKASHYGSYESTVTTHELMDKWITENGKTVTGNPWEVYVTDPGVETDQSKWLTEIYYPVK